MRKANVALTISLSMSVPDIKSDDSIEGIAYWIVKNFLDGFDMEINGCKLLANSVHVEERFTSVNMPVPNYVAEQIVLEEDEEEYGDLSHNGETLDEFIQWCKEDFSEYGTEDPDGKFIYDVPLGIINTKLNGCGVKMISTEQWRTAEDKAIKELVNKC